MIRKVGDTGTIISFSELCFPGKVLIPHYTSKSAICDFPFVEHIVHGLEDGIKMEIEIEERF